MSAWTLSDGFSTESFYPTYTGYKAKGSLISDAGRTRSGKRYSYNWSSYKKWDLPVKFINSSQTYLFNQWWSLGTYLSLSPGNGSEVYTVQIVGNNQPISGVVRPYTDLFMGKMLVEEVK